MVAYKDGVTISELLAEHLAESDKSANDLASEFGVSQATVSRWVNGKDVPGSARVPELATVLGLAAEQIVMALHAQRTSRPSTGQRLDALERTVTELANVVESLRRRRGR